MDANMRRLMAADAEEFLSLEDENSLLLKQQESSSDSESKPASNTVSEPAIIEAEAIDMSVVGEYAGSHTISWPIQDMDCPHCAGVAMNALNRLEQVCSSTVSATEGTVTIEVDLEKGNIASASAMLNSLGNPPDLPFMQISGVNTQAIAARHSVAVKMLPRVFKRQPGVLNSQLDKNRNILIQLAPNLDPKLQSANENALKKVIGGDYKLVKSQGNRLSPGQWRMMSSGIAFIILLTVLALEMAEVNPLIIALLGLVGVIIGGTKMFSQAIASAHKRQLGFQVLTSLAVIGASILQHWEEALMVIILVSWTEHMENEALIKARNAMQGGLDRLPRTARRV